MAAKKQVGKYEIGRTLGEGTFGKVKHAAVWKSNFRRPAPSMRLSDTGSYLPTCFLAAIVLLAVACGATAAETDALAGWEQRLRAARATGRLSTCPASYDASKTTSKRCVGQRVEPQRVFFAGV